MAITSQPRGYNKRLWIMPTAESTYGTSNFGISAKRFHLPPGAGLMRAWKETITDTDTANGSEFEKKRFFLEERIAGEYSGVWASPELFGILFAHVLGLDSVSTVDTTGKQHTITMLPSTTAPVSFTMAETPMNESAALARRYTGCQVESVTLTIGQRGFATLSWRVVGMKYDGTSNYSSSSYDNFPLALTVNSRVSVFIDAASEGDSLYDNSITTPSGGAAPSSDDIGGGTNISSYIQNLSFTVNSNFDDDSAFGPGAATDAGIQSRLRIPTTRSASGSMTLAVDTTTDGFVEGLISETDSNQNQYTLQISSTTDKQIGAASLYAGWTLVLPLIVFEPGWSVSGDLGPKYMTCSFHPQKETATTDFDAMLAWAWTQDATTYSQAP